MAKEKYLILHCSATPEGRDYNERQIRGWFKSRGWRNPGYRQITHLDGSVTVLQDYDSDGYISRHEITNGAKGWNTEAFHYSYIGGVSAENRHEAKDTRTAYQHWSMAIQVWNALLLNPDLIICGHNQISAKACPSFDVPEWLQLIGVPAKNILQGTIASFYDPTNEGDFDLELNTDELFKKEQ